MNPKDIIVWAQIGGQMVQLATTGVNNIKSILQASGATAEQQAATLARTRVLYDAAIAHEEAIAKGT